MKKLIRGYQLVGLEKEVFRLAYQAYDNYGFALTNEEVAEKAGISIDYLYEVLNNIDKKINNSGSYYSD